ncbi:glycosyltransferase family 4 protein [Glaciibacter flavus]|uniref:Glycosyltransferase family 4 protein n=1 Tax=Orlajensenia flava TaxID=2565934 RepID=A0A4S4G1P8_9MICO|nr:glycosyltransferase family 4 protein [Glaciibacter flavus]THG36046.1 glycosyltransferase family 4 protein [Glaciibacter flavus]
MTTLRVIADVGFSAGGEPGAAFARDITTSLVLTAPANCDVEALIGAGSAEGGSEIGGAPIVRAALASRELAVAWQLGVTLSGGGLIHSPSLLAPLKRHSRSDGDQTTVTVRDLDAWRHPASLRPVDVAWTKAMLRRARKSADAVVVATHALAGRLTEIADFGDRIRVIPVAPPTDLLLPTDPEAHSRSLGLPKRYVAIACHVRNRALAEQISKKVRLGDDELSVVILQRGALAETTSQPSPEPSDLVIVDADGATRAVIISRAEIFVLAADGGDEAELLLEPLAVGTPVAHLADAAYAEIAQDAAVGVVAAHSDLAAALAETTQRLLADESELSRRRIAVADRQRLFSWRETGEQIWRLHADL